MKYDASLIIKRSNVARHIREAREYRDITQLQMANHLQVARQTYLDIESGKTEPKMSSLVIIASVTGRPLNWFLYGESSIADVAFTHREEIDKLLALFNQMSSSSRELILEQAIQMAEYLGKSTSSYLK